MKNYHLNANLISTLPRVLRMTHAETTKTVDIASTTWYRIAGEPKVITVQQLLQLANGLRIPVRKFFWSGRTALVGLREDYIVFNGYKPCCYRIDAVRKCLGPGTATSWQKASKAIGMHWTSTSASMLLERPLPVERLLAICNAFDFNLFEFLFDPNPETAAHRQMRQNAGLTPEEISDLRRQVADLQNTVSDLSDKYTQLLTEYRKLTTTSGHYEIHHFTDSNIAFAAESKMKQSKK